MADEIYGAQVCIAGLTTGQIAAPARPRPGAPPPGDTDICPDAKPVAAVARQLDTYADQLLDGWSGHVRVGPLQPVAGPSR